MAVKKNIKIISESETTFEKLNSRYSYRLSSGRPTSGRLRSGRLHLGLRGYSQLLLYSFLFSYPSFSSAGPAGGNIVGGGGHIHVSGLTTDIHQTTASLAINWNSYNLSANEVVNYLQPSASSIALNRITGNGGSQILGQINANGQVVLVNPNGIFFGASASVNVGGLIASGLDIKPIDFMNGNYVFSSIDGTSGAVINGGILNASLGGGSISLIGQQVKNEGLISANLGAVNLAAGKEAVLTFDNEGLMGVKISKAVLQDELGVDPAILNSGEITAAGGRVLLTASQSQDIFSQAVNSNGIEQATSVVVNADGSFTLGGGADVVNTGTVDVSAIDRNAGKIAVLGENISSSGIITADSANGNGGEIELHATDTTLLTENSLTSAQSAKSGKGGEIKVLGDKVGLFDQSTVDASGTNGGGEILIGGDIQGQNNRIRNADFIYLGEKTVVKANALDSGKGGKIITFSDNTSRIYGSLQARGGLNAGDGGFIETSGLKSFQITAAPDISSPTGLGGEWLIDPDNIRIVGGNGNTNINDGTPLTPVTAFVTTDNGAILGVDLITAALKESSARVTITTSTDRIGTEQGDITFATTLNYDGIGTNDTLTLNAANDIIFLANQFIADINLNTADSLNINLYANGNIILNNGVIIDTQGGDFTVGDTANGLIPTSFTSRAGARINTSGIDFLNSTVPTDAGNINITASEAVSINSLVATGGLTGASSTASGNRTGRNGGNVTVVGSSVTVNNAIDTSGSAGRYDTNQGGRNGRNGGNGGFVDITATSGNISVAAITTSGGDAAGRASTIDVGIGGDAGTIDLSVSAGNSITLSGDLLSKGAIGFINEGIGGHGNGADITLAGDVVLANNILIDTQGFVGQTGAPGTDGAILFENSISADNRGGARTLQLISGLNNTTVVGGIGTGADNALQSLTISRANNARLAAITTQSGGVLITADNIIEIAGNIDTSDTGGVVNGGNVLLGANNITVGGIDTRSGVTAGDVSISATERLTPSVIAPSITLNGDINARSGVDGAGLGGISKVAQLSLVSTSSASVTINYTGDFTGRVNINGSAGIDTFSSANKNNVWDINGVGSGRLGASVTFSEFENLLGNGGIDNFIFSTNAASIDGLIDGGTGLDEIFLFSGTTTTVQLAGLADQTGNSILEINGIEKLTGNSGSNAGNNVLLGENATTNWFISAAGAGSVGGNALTLTPTENETIFSGFNTLNGGSANDTFNIIYATGFGNAQVTLNGGTNAANVDNDTLVLAGPNAIDVNWNIDRQNGGTLVDKAGAASADLLNISFDHMENLTSGVGNDTFSFVPGFDVDGNIDAGDGIDDIDLSGDTGAIVFSVAGGVNSGKRRGFDQVTGNGFNSTLIGDTTNIWNIDNVNSGTVAGTGGTLIFRAFNNLTGGSGTDTFNIIDNGVTQGNITGLIDGAAGTNTLDIFTPANLLPGGTGAAVIVQLEGVSGISNDVAADPTDANFNGAIDVVNINTITASANIAFNNEIRAGNSAANNWLVEGDRRGTINNVNTNVRFNGFTSLSGADAVVDNFSVTALTLPQQMALSGGSSVDATQFDTLQGANLDARWRVSAEDTGTVTDEAGVGAGVFAFALVFNGIEVLSGGTGVDNFVLQGNSTLRGTIDGGRGAAIDSLAGNTGANTWDITGADQGFVEGVDTGNSNADFDFTGIESLTGNSGTDNFTLNGGTLRGTIDGAGGNDTLTGGARLNTWEVSALNEGSVNGLDNSDSNLAYDFTGIENLVGSSATDNFVLNGGTLSGTIDGGTGEDSLTAGNVANNWVINGANQGNVTGVDEAGVNGAYDFIEIENITGGILDDRITFRDGASISGTVNGGAENRTGAGSLVGQGDTLDMSAVSGAIEIVIGETPLSAAGMNIVSIETITGNNDGTDINNTNTSQLTGEQADVANGDITNTWVLFDNTGAGGLVNDGTVSNESGSTTFINFTALQGSDRDDAFDRSSPGTLAMSVDGGSEQNADQLDFSNQLDGVTVDLNVGLDTTIAGIEGVIGNDFNSTLIAKDGQLNVWQIDGNNDGILNVNGPDSMTFTNFNILQGGNGIDNFTVINSGSIGNQDSPQTDALSGIKGGAGVDTLITNSSVSAPGHILFEGEGGDDQVRLTLTGDQNGSFTFNGGGDNDTLDILGGITGNSNYTEVYTPDVGGSDQLVYTNSNADNTTSVYSVAFTNINNGAVNDNVTALSLTINGSANADDIITLDSNVNTDNFQLNANTQVNYTSKANLLVDGLGGADVININSALNFAGARVELNAQTITNAANNTFTISANDLLLNASTSIGNGGAVIGSAGNALRTNVTNLALVGVDGRAFIAEQGALNITELSNNNGRLDITANGTVSSAVDLRSAANIDIAAGVGDVIFASTNNRLTGRLSFSGDTVTLNNSAFTRLNNIGATTLNVSTTQGRILDVNSGTVQVTGLSTLNAPLILLDGPNLNLAELEVNNSTSVRINNGANALNVRGINSTGLVNISSGTLLATGDIAGANIILNTQGASVTVNTLNAANAININTTDLTGNAGTGNVSFNGVTANTGGIIISGNDIVQGGDLISEGSVVFNATGSFNMASGTTMQVSNGGFFVNAAGQIILQSMAVTNDIGLSSTTDSISVNGLISTSQGNITVRADQDIFMSADLSALLNIDLTTTNGVYSQLLALDSTQGNIVVNSGAGIFMFSNASSTATTGSIQYNAQDSVNVSILSAVTGKVGINSNTGEVTDANTGAMNFIADILEIRAVTGIGSGDQLETQVAQMDVINTDDGRINFQQTGDIELVALQNTGILGSIEFNSDRDINLNPNSVFAARNQGLGEQGLFSMQTTEGNIFGLGSSDLNNPDISAQDAIIRVRNGSFGTRARPITLDVVNSVLIDANILFDPRFVPPGPLEVNTSGINFSLRGVISAIASEQLVEIETLAEIDPAIFTDLQNYSSEEISIRMPRDQLFEDELEVADKTAF